MRFSIVALPILFIISQLAHSHADHSHSYDWPNGKKAAVILSYDDSTNTQLDVAIPQLDAFGFKATFFVNGANNSFSSRLNDWRAVAENGHELANHTLFHPCKKSEPNRDWVADHHDADRYSVARLIDEVRVGNILLEALDGKNQRTFAYPCGEKAVGGKPYITPLKNEVIAARGGSKTGLNNPTSFDRFDIGALDASGLSGKKLINAVEKTLAENNFIVLTFHGVGGDFLTVESESHRQLLAYLKANENLYWVDTLNNVLSSLEP